MTQPFEVMTDVGAHRVLLLSDPPSGLQAMIAIDDLSRGPACGGIRTQAYSDFAAALADVRKLSAAMTLKCRITGLAAGGGKTVVLNHAKLDRPAAFRKLGEFINELGGIYHCAGDLGTTEVDLGYVAERTSYCDMTGQNLGRATGETVVNGILACANDRDIHDLKGLRVAIQGCGMIGDGVARALAAQGAELIIADANPVVAAALAEQIGATQVPADDILSVDADVLAPCAIGGILDAEAVSSLKVWAICGGANNQLAEPSVADMLLVRGISYIPDFLSSSGAVIDGVCRNIMRCDPTPYIAQTRVTAMDILADARQRGRSTLASAIERAGSVEPERG